MYYYWYLQFLSHICMWSQAEQDTACPTLTTYEMGWGSIWCVNWSMFDEYVQNAFYIFVPVTLTFDFDLKFAPPYTVFVSTKCIVYIEFWSWVIVGVRRKNRQTYRQMQRVKRPPKKSRIIYREKVNRLICLWFHFNVVREKNKCKNTYISSFCIPLNLSTSFSKPAMPHHSLVRWDAELLDVLANGLAVLVRKWYNGMAYSHRHSTNTLEATTVSMTWKTASATFLQRKHICIL